MMLSGQVGIDGSNLNCKLFYVKTDIGREPNSSINEDLRLKRS